MWLSFQARRNYVTILYHYQYKKISMHLFSSVLFCFVLCFRESGYGLLIYWNLKAGIHSYSSGWQDFFSFA